MELIKVDWDSRYIETDKRWHYQPVKNNSFCYQLYLDGRSIMAWNHVKDGEFKKVADWFVKYQPDIPEAATDVIHNEPWNIQPALLMIKALWFKKRGKQDA